MSTQNLSNMIWSVADLLRGDYKQADYGTVILPFTLLRRLDCALEATKVQTLAEQEKRSQQVNDTSRFLTRVTGYSFYNISKLDMTKLLADHDNIKLNLKSYLDGFASNVTDIFENYKFDDIIDFLDKSKLLYLVVQRFASYDLHPNVVSNADMGTIFEELIRKFAEDSNATAGEHFTPREVIRLMVNLLFYEDDAALNTAGTIRTLYDPCAGTGGMLSIAEEYLAQMHPEAKLVVSGQELNPESYAICKGDMLIKGQNVNNIIFGDTLRADGHADTKFDYGLSNPPFGVDWKKAQKEVVDEHERLGHNGRFGPKLPGVDDGSLLFLLHLISKMEPVKFVDGKQVGGGRIAIVLNGSSLFTGRAGSGESETRRWVIEHDMLETIIALPMDMFYNTPIATYIWVLTNHKVAQRRGKIQLINAVEFFQKMRKSLNFKRKELGDKDIEGITKLFGSFEDDGKYSKIFENRDFGYSTITVERPLRLAFQITKDGLERLRVSKPFASYDSEQWKLAEIELDCRLREGTRWLSRKQFLHDMAKDFDEVDLPAPSATQRKALVTAFGSHDDAAELCCDSQGRPEPSSDLRDTENVPFSDDIEAYFEREVLPHVPDAWIDHAKSKVGYEIPFTRHFYKFQPPRSLEAIDHDLQAVTNEIMDLLREVTHAG